MSYWTRGIAAARRHRCERAYVDVAIYRSMLPSTHHCCISTLWWNVTRVLKSDGYQQYKGSQKQRKGLDSA